VPQRYFTEPYQFVPPYQSRLWCRLFRPIFPHYVRKSLGLARLEFRGLDRLRASLRAGAGILLTPNHSRWLDAGAVAMLGLALRQFFYYLISYHLFKQSRMLGWYLHRLGCFSVQREGADREAIRTSAAILARAERPLVIFPEGTWFRQNDRVGPLQEGVALITRHAARAATRPLVIHPVAIKYWLLADPRPALRTRLARLEAHLSWRPQEHLELLPRIDRALGGLLTVKEIERFGTPRSGSLAERISGLAESHIQGLEATWFGRPERGPHLPRIRHLRQRLVRALRESSAAEIAPIQRQLDDLLFCENLLANAQDYLHERPSFERLAEAVERLEETLADGPENPVVPLGAVVEVGPVLSVTAGQDEPPARAPCAPAA
jgi:1-acyl-sn-glycerol-3-phosphate acyltransferase